MNIYTPHHTCTAAVMIELESSHLLSFHNHFFLRCLINIESNLGTTADNGKIDLLILDL